MNNEINCGKGNSQDCKDCFFKIIDERKTIRNFSSYIPPVDDIKRLINSARVAPSACNTQNWEFIAVYNQEIKDKMANAVLETYDEIAAKLNDKETIQNFLRFKDHSTFFSKTPVVIVCVLKEGYRFLSDVLEAANYSADEIKKMRPDSHLLSMGGAIENILLSAHAMGLGGCWMVAPVIAAEKFNKILNLEKTDKIVSLLAIGEPANAVGRSPKKNLDEVMKIVK